MAKNTQQLLVEVIDYLSANNVDAWVFGGWAEEITGTKEPSQHKDIDLFYFSNDFVSVDKLIVSKNLPEIKEKHFHHKRAFNYKDVMVELFLVERDKKGYFTNFWGKKKYYWPENIQGKKDGLRVILPNGLAAYRNDYDQIDKLRIVLR